MVGASGAAGTHFTDGTRLFQHGDYRAAGVEFDAAFASRPHHDALWNAAQSWERAQELARAANRYARYLDIAPHDAPDRDRATAALARLSIRLGRIEVFAGAAAEVEVDGEPAPSSPSYVYPGAHVVTARLGEKSASQTIEVGAGAVESVVLSADGSPSPGGATSPPAPSTSEAVAKKPEIAPGESKRSEVWLVGALGAATLAAAGLTVWSGVDTLAARDDFLSRPTQATLDGGRSREVRTNVLIGTTAALGVLTLASAAFLVQWRSPDRRVRAGIGPTGGGLLLSY